MSNKPIYIDSKVILLEYVHQTWIRFAVKVDINMLGKTVQEEKGGGEVKDQNLQSPANWSGEQLVLMVMIGL